MRTVLDKIEDRISELKADRYLYSQSGDNHGRAIRDAGIAQLQLVKYWIEMELSK